MRRAAGGHDTGVARRADIGDAPRGRRRVKGHLDCCYRTAGHPKQLRSRRAVASALGLSGDWRRGTLRVHPRVNVREL